jgi:hypothetical protein
MAHDRQHPCRPPAGRQRERAMAFSGQVLDNPISGERFVFRQTAGETDGRLLAFDLVLAPNGHVPGGHVHPEQEERFHFKDFGDRLRQGPIGLDELNRLGAPHGIRFFDDWIPELRAAYNLRVIGE